MRFPSRRAAAVVALLALVAFGTLLAPSVLPHDHSGSRTEKDCVACRSVLPTVGVLDLRLPSLAPPASSGPVPGHVPVSFDEHDHEADGARGPPRA
jgi:hypothetical protein